MRKWSVFGILPWLLEMREKTTKISKFLCLIFSVWEIHVVLSSFYGLLSIYVSIIIINLIINLTNNININLI
jgi:hypothetical protein